MNNDQLQLLKTQGFVIIPNVLNQGQIDRSRVDFWDWMAQFPSAPDASALDGPVSGLPPRTHGIFKHFNIGQSQFMWNLRTLPEIRALFEFIHGTEDLCCSLDGAQLAPPPRAEPNTWLHIDQGPKKRGFHCYQGYVTLNSAPGAGTYFLKNSHLVHSKFWDTHPEEAKNCGAADWFKLTPDQIDWYQERDCPLVHVSPNPGDFVIWDSRLVHQGSPPEKGLTPASENFRLAAYITYSPKRLQPNNSISKRRKAFIEGRTTSHWPHHIRLNAKFPQTYGDKTLLEKWPIQPSAIFSPEINKLL